jgi:hypothetical protein
MHAFKKRTMVKLWVYRSIPLPHISSVRLPVLRNHLLGRLSALDVAKAQCKGPVDVRALSKPGIDIEHAFSVLLRPLLLQHSGQVLLPNASPPLFPVRRGPGATADDATSPQLESGVGGAKADASGIHTSEIHTTVVIVIDGLDEAEDEESLFTSSNEAPVYHTAGPHATRGVGILRLLTSFLTRLPSKTFRFFLTASRPQSRIQVRTFWSAFAG